MGLPDYKYTFLKKTKNESLSELGRGNSSKKG